jgi:hypothetical protein
MPPIFSKGHSDAINGGAQTIGATEKIMEYCLGFKVAYNAEYY